jgi:hypothetical protein
MENNLEQQRQHRESIRQGKLSAQEGRAWEQAEATTAKATKATVVDAPVDYDAKTKQAVAEMAERSANMEARGIEQASTPKGFDDLEFIKYNTSYRRLADFVGLPANDVSKYANELGVIMGWALDSTDSDNIVDLLSEIKNLKKTLGFQEVGPTAIKKLYQYIRLDLDTKRASKEQLENLNKEKELLKA